AVQRTSAPASTGVAQRDRRPMVPSASTSPASNFVPPMSTASTGASTAADDSVRLGSARPTGARSTPYPVRGGSGPPGGAVGGADTRGAHVATQETESRLEGFAARAQAIVDNVERVIQGKRDVIELMLVTVQ